MDCALKLGDLKLSSQIHMRVYWVVLAWFFRVTEQPKIQVKSLSHCGFVSKTSKESSQVTYKLPEKFIVEFGHFLLTKFAWWLFLAWLGIMNT